MDYSTALAFGIGALVIMYYARIYLTRFELIGKPCPIKNPQDDSKPWQIFYFYSGRCSKCIGVTSVMEEHAKKHASIRTVNIATDLALAKKFNVLATPTVICVENDIVTDIHFGNNTLQVASDFIQAQQPEETND